MTQQLPKVLINIILNYVNGDIENKFISSNIYKTDKDFLSVNPSYSSDITNENKYDDVDWLWLKKNKEDKEYTVFEKMLSYSENKSHIMMFINHVKHKYFFFEHKFRNSYLIISCVDGNIDLRWISSDNSYTVDNFIKNKLYDIENWLSVCKSTTNIYKLKYKNLGDICSSKEITKKNFDFDIIEQENLNNIDWLWLSMDENFWNKYNNKCLNKLLVL